MVKTLKDNNRLKEPKINRPFFIILHSAFSVEYNISDFRFKNKEEADVQNSLFGSKNFCLLDIVSPEIEETKLAQKKSYLGTSFRTHIKDLICEVEKCQLHFVRCIKPNNLNKPYIFQQK